MEHPTHFKNRPLAKAVAVFAMALVSLGSTAFAHGPQSSGTLPAATQPAPTTTRPAGARLTRLPPHHRLYATLRQQFENDKAWMLFDMSESDVKTPEFFGDGPGVGAAECLQRLTDVSGLLAERVDGTRGHIHAFVLLCDAPESAPALVTGRIREVHARLEKGMALVKASKMQVKEIEVPGADWQHGPSRCRAKTWR